MLTINDNIEKFTKSTFTEYIPLYQNLSQSDLKHLCNQNSTDACFTYGLNLMFNVHNKNTNNNELTDTFSKCAKDNAHCRDFFLYILYREGNTINKSYIYRLNNNKTMFSVLFGVYLFLNEDRIYYDENKEFSDVVDDIENVFVHTMINYLVNPFRFIINYKPLGKNGESVSRYNQIKYFMEYQFITKSEIPSQIIGEICQYRDLCARLMSYLNKLDRKSYNNEDIFFELLKAREQENYDYQSITKKLFQANTKFSNEMLFIFHIYKFINSSFEGLEQFYFTEANKGNLIMQCIINLGNLYKIQPFSDGKGKIYGFLLNDNDDQAFEILDSLFLLKMKMNNDGSTEYFQKYIMLLLKAISYFHLDYYLEYNQIEFYIRQREHLKSLYLIERMTMMNNIPAYHEFQDYFLRHYSLYKNINVCIPLREYTVTPDYNSVGKRFIDNNKNIIYIMMKFDENWYEVAEAMQYIQKKMGEMRKTNILDSFLMKFNIVTYNIITKIKGLADIRIDMSFCFIILRVLAYLVCMAIIMFFHYHIYLGIFDKPQQTIVTSYRKKKRR